MTQSVTSEDVDMPSLDRTESILLLVTAPKQCHAKDTPYPSSEAPIAGEMLWKWSRSLHDIIGDTLHRIKQEARVALWKCDHGPLIKMTLQDVKAS